MQPGDVALFRPRGFIGRVVSFGTMSRYCHVRLIVGADGSTVEANPPGAFRGRVQDGDVVVSVPLTDEQRAQVATTATALVGIPYGYLDVVVLGLAQVGIRLPFLKRRLARKDRLFCSQLVDVVWQSVGYHAFTKDSDPAYQCTRKERLPQNVSPGDIADLAFCESWATKVQEGATS